MHTNANHQFAVANVVAPKDGNYEKIFYHEQVSSGELEKAEENPKYNIPQHLLHKLKKKKRNR